MLIHLPNILCLTTVALAISSTLLCGQDVYWTQTGAPIKNWQSAASSSDGVRFVAVASPGGIYTSTDSAATWTQTAAPVAYWWSAASSSDGVKLVAVVCGGGIHTSPNSGAAWTQTSAPTAAWYAVASSSDGVKLVAGVWQGGIYTSTNSGATWAQTSAPVAYWWSVASSFDGVKLVAVASPGGIYASTDSGATWTQTSAPTANWSSVASSSDGVKLVAGVWPGGVYTSTDSGATWTQTSAPTTNWNSVASSSDGLKLVAVASVDGIYSSTDSGASWTHTSAPAAYWWSVASSSDGIKLVAVASPGGIFTNNFTTNTMPVITRQPESTSSCPGSSATFAVTARPLQQSGFQWRKNGTNFADSGNVTGSATNGLRLLSVSQEDVGNYDVVFTTAYGSVTSSVASLTLSPILASATPIVLNGFIIGAIVLSGGCGYSRPPAISFSGQSGSGATGYAQISDGTVTNIVVTSAGYGYSTNTLLLIAPPVYPAMGITLSLSNPPSAAAIPIITNGYVIGASLTAGGSYYVEAPSVSFTDVSGHGAMAYAEIDSGSVVSIEVTNAGFGYSSNTVLNISPPPSFGIVTLSASNLIAGRVYQLRIANDPDKWTDYGLAFIANNTTWSSTDYWNAAITNRMFFRLQMLQ